MILEKFRRIGVTFDEVRVQYQTIKNYRFILLMKSLVLILLKRVKKIRFLLLVLLKGQLLSPTKHLSYSIR